MATHDIYLAKLHDCQDQIRDLYAKVSEISLGQYSNEKQSQTTFGFDEQVNLDKNLKNSSVSCKKCNILSKRLDEIEKQFPKKCGSLDFQTLLQTIEQIQECQMQNQVDLHNYATMLKRMDFEIKQIKSTPPQTVLSQRDFDPKSDNQLWAAVSRLLDKNTRDTKEMKYHAKRLQDFDQSLFQLKNKVNSAQEITRSLQTEVNFQNSKIDLIYDSIQVKNSSQFVNRSQIIDTNRTPDENFKRLAEFGQNIPLKKYSLPDSPLNEINQINSGVGDLRKNSVNSIIVTTSPLDDINLIQREHRSPQQSIANRYHKKRFVAYKLMEQNSAISQRSFMPQPQTKTRNHNLSLPSLNSGSLPIINQQKIYINSQKKTKNSLVQSIQLKIPYRNNSKQTEESSDEM